MKLACFENYSYHLFSLLRSDSLKEFINSIDVQKLKPEIDSQDHNGDTLMHIAARKDNAEIILFLRNNLEANLNIKNYFQLTPKDCLDQDLPVEIANTFGVQNENGIFSKGSGFLRGRPVLKSAVANFALGATSAALTMYFNRDRDGKKPDNSQPPDIVSRLTQDSLVSDVSRFAGHEVTRAVVAVAPAVSDRCVLL